MGRARRLRRARHDHAGRWTQAHRHRDTLPRMRFPSLALAALLVGACSSAPPPLVRDYTAYVGTLPPGSGGTERTARLTLRDGGVAAVQLSAPAPGGDFFAEGTWQQRDDGVVIELTSPRPERLVFRRSGDLILGRECDRALYSGN